MENAQPVAVTDSRGRGDFHRQGWKGSDLPTSLWGLFGLESTVPEGFLKAADFTVEVREKQ